MRVGAVSWFFLILLAACAGAPAPEWQLAAHHAFSAHARAFLAGEERLAKTELERARRAVARTADAHERARLELAACALRVASLLGGECPEFWAIAEDADAAARAYADYLGGRWEGLDTALLPPAQRAVPAARDDNGLLAGIEDPLSRLVAAAALFRAGRLSVGGIERAIETASRQGWRRPLLAWLTVERERRERSGDHAGAARIERRIRLLMESSAR